MEEQREHVLVILYPVSANQSGILKKAIQNCADLA